MALLYDISKTLAEKYHGGILSETPEHDISYFSGFVVAAYGEVKRKRLQEKRKEAKENRSYNRLNDFVELSSVYPLDNTWLLADKIGKNEYFIKYPAKPYDPLGSAAIVDLILKDCGECGANTTKIDKKMIGVLNCLPGRRKSISWAPEKEGVRIFSSNGGDKLEVRIQMVTDEPDLDASGNMIIDTDMLAQVLDLAYNLAVKREKSDDGDRINDSTDAMTVFNAKMRNYPK